MVGVPVNLMPSGKTPLANYDFFDIAAGVGYERFYAGAFITSTETNYILTTQQIDGDIDSRYTTITDTNTELNFDIVFLRPMVISGYAYINFTYSTTGAASVYTIFTLFRVRGGSETQIGTVTTNTKASPGASVYRRLAKMSLTNTKIAIGDSLRLEVKFYTAAPGISATINYDPGSRQTTTETGTGATIGTDLTVDVGFKTEL